MGIESTNNVRASAPLQAPLQPVAGPPKAPAAAKDTLDVKARAHAGDVAEAELAAAALPPRGHFLILHSQQDDWVRQGTGPVLKAYHALQVLEGLQQDPMTARPQAVIDAARAKVGQLAAELASHDPRGVRREALQGDTRELSLAIRIGADLSDPPLRGTMTKEQFAKAQQAWVQGQQAEIAAGRAAAAKLGERAELLHYEDASAHMGPIFDAVEQRIQEKVGPVQWSQLIHGLIEVGGAVGSEIARQQDRAAHKPHL